jgi:hypothetical protein
MRTDRNARPTAMTAADRIRLARYPKVPRYSLPAVTAAKWVGAIVAASFAYAYFW